MKNQYVGDVGDFCKYGLLRALFNNSYLKLGVNWYFNGTDNKPVGRHTAYLDKSNSIGEKLKKCDESLYNKLYRIVKIENKRDIRRIEQTKILREDTIFFANNLDDFEERGRWHRMALKILEKADVIFLDPDNGINTNNSNITCDASINEIKDYFRQGQTVIVYNQRSHQKDDVYEKRFQISRRELSGCIFRRLRARRGTARDFCFFIQPKHKEDVCVKLDEFLSSIWAKDHHFELRQ
jgi:hypothetical protein